MTFTSAAAHRRRTRIATPEPAEDHADNEDDDDDTAGEEWKGAA